VLSLYRAKPDDGVVVCFDEMGPIQLIPHHGSGWAPAERPERQRATYSKKNGVRYLFGAYDVHADRLHGRLRAHKKDGYLSDASGDRVNGQMDAAGVLLHRVHASGHARVADLRHLADALAPARIVPIHTAAPERYAETFDRVERHADGEWWQA